MAVCQKVAFFPTSQKVSIVFFGGVFLFTSHVDLGVVAQRLFLGIYVLPALLVIPAPLIDGEVGDDIHTGFTVLAPDVHDDENPVFVSLFVRLVVFPFVACF